uniref:Uncharacterized protein n=1 Tax=Anopheles dirus TaxID=7168 RepID=A0A182MZ36_9DIPT
MLRSTLLPTREPFMWLLFQDTWSTRSRIAPVVGQATGHVGLYDGRLHRSVCSVQRRVRGVQMGVTMDDRARVKAGGVFLHHRRTMQAPVAVRTGGVAVVGGVRCAITQRRCIRQRSVVIVVVRTRVVDGMGQLGVSCLDDARNSQRGNSSNNQLRVGHE